jgi:opacity protein-like surface antigen
MRMKTYLILAVGLFLLGGTALAQEDAPKFELFGGFSYMRVAGNANVNGWNAQGTYNLKKWIGVAGDFGGIYQTMSNDTIRPSASMTTFMFGPQLYDRVGRVTGFAHALFGATRVTKGFNLGKGGTDANASNLSVALGGGVDANVTDKIAIRVFSVDYFMLRVNNALTNNTEGRSNFRLSMGIVFKFK